MTQRAPILTTSPAPSTAPSPATPFARFIAVAEHLYEGEWCVLAAPEKCLPVVGWLYCQDDEAARTPLLILSTDSGRLYLAERGTQGRTEDEALTELFSDLAARLFDDALAA